MGWPVSRARLITPGLETRAGPSGPSVRIAIVSPPSTRRAIDRSSPTAPRLLEPRGGTASPRCGRRVAMCSPSRLRLTGTWMPLPRKTPAAASTLRCQSAPSWGRGSGVAKGSGPSKRMRQVAASPRKSQAARGARIGRARLTSRRSRRGPRVGRRSAASRPCSSLPAGVITRVAPLERPVFPTAPCVTPCARPPAPTDGTGVGVGLQGLPGMGRYNRHPSRSPRAGEPPMDLSYAREYEGLRGLGLPCHDYANRSSGQ